MMFGGIGGRRRKRSRGAGSEGPEVEARWPAGSRLRAAPTSWGSSAYEISDGSHRVSTLGFRLFRDRGSFRLQGRPYDIAREGWRGPFVLSTGPRIRARARKPRVFGREIRILVDPDGARTGWDEAAASPTEYVLTPVSRLRRQWELVQAGAPMGSVRRAGAFSRSIEVDLAEGIDQDVGMFALWLVIRAWRRAAAAVAASG